MRTVAFRYVSAMLVAAALAVWPGATSDAGEEPYRLDCTELATGVRVVCLPLRRDETFTVRYIHSVDGTPVFEIFEVDREGRLALQATYFKMFGAGMGHWEGRGRLDFDGLWTWIRDIHQPLGAFVLRVGAPTVNHTILYRNREIPLSERWPGKRLRVEVVPATEGDDCVRAGDQG